MTKNYDYVLQETDNDCGISSLQTILLHFGLKTSREKLINELELTNEGVSAYDLIKLGKKYGLNGYGVKGNIEKLNSKLLPVIAHTIKNNNFYHFIVILENNTKNKTLKIMDPSTGIENITYDKFNKITTQIFIVFENKNIEKEKDIRFKKILLEIFHQNKKLIFKTLIFSVIFIILSITYNYYLKIIINSKNFFQIIFILVLFTNVSLFKNIMEYIKNKTTYALNLSIDKKITKKVISHIIHLPYKYYKSKKVGELVTIINDIENFKEIITKVFVLCLIDAFLMIIVLIYISFYSIFYMLILLMFIIFYIFINFKYQYIFNDIYVKIKNKKIKYNSSLVSSLYSFDSIKNLNIETKVIKNIFNSYSEVLYNDKKYNNKYYKYNFYTNLLIDLSYLLLSFFTLMILKKTGKDISYIILLSNFFSIIFNFMTSISDCLVLRKIYQTSIDKVLDVLDVKEEIFNITRLEEIKKLEYKNVSYNIYDKNILNNINLVINSKDHLFIKGKSGIGKSTMMKLLLKYDDVTSGNILIDDVDINALDLSFIRKSITYISQNEALLSDTLKDNLNIVSSNKKDLDKACKTVLLDEMFIDKKINYDLYIEENGSNLSGGQKKKIILARGLLKKSKVLILDEVFNEIDVLEERQILKNIFKNYPNLIIIVISHRYNNIDLFNKIYELKEE